MTEFKLRPATTADSQKIRDLINRVQINPMGLDWQHFVIAVDESGAILGCGQLKRHQGDVIELASIAVEPPYRNQGIARAIIEHLIAQGPRPLYLTCRASLGLFYEQWGFRAIGRDEMPTYFRRLSRVAAAMSHLFSDDDGLLVMQLM
jgi:N-acetylglutamate synthase-like GNAT family acetyltransferase